MTGKNDPEVVVLIPCFNEEITIGNVVGAFKSALPEASVYVYDNNSSDKTIEIAEAAGAIVRREGRQGKGNVVRRMFADIDADIYILVDGDDTYDVSISKDLIERIRSERLDLINGLRDSETNNAYRAGHKFGNWLFSALVKRIFGRQFDDMLSGYKILSRRFVKSFPAMAYGFEIETEIIVHALELRMPSAEIEVGYRGRPPGSVSKLNKYGDGLRILVLIARLIKDERPLGVFGIGGCLLILSALVTSFPLLQTYLETGLVPRFPTAVLSIALVIVGMLSIFAGLILDMITKMRREAKRLSYLSIAPFG